MNLNDAAAGALGTALASNTALQTLRVATSTQSLSAWGLFQIVSGVHASRAPLKHVYLPGGLTVNAEGRPAYVARNRVPLPTYSLEVAEVLDALLAAGAAANRGKSPPHALFEADHRERAEQARARTVNGVGVGVGVAAAPNGGASPRKRAGDGTDEDDEHDDQHLSWTLPSEAVLRRVARFLGS